MPKRCVVLGCSSVAGPGISLHKFPDNPQIRKKWNSFIKTHRYDWKEPTKFSFVCSRHFLPECFAGNPAVKTALGFKDMKPRLKDGSIPTLSYKHLDWNSDKSQVSTKRSVYEKREHLRLLASAAEPMVYTKSTAGTGMIAQDNKIYNAAEKSVRDVKVQVQVHATVRSKGVQWNWKPKTHSIGIQCDLLKPFQHSSPCISEIDENEMDENDTDNDEVDEYEPEKNYMEDDEYMDLSSDDSTNSDPSYIPAKEERKFIVFESALLQLFTICIACQGSCASAVVSSVIGTMIIVEQTCKTCGNKWHWLSQNKIGKIPAGNLLLSSAILFCGALPRKTLRVLKVMGVAAISPVTYFNHQRKYLHTVVQRAWENHIQQLHRDLKGKDLILGGDGRNDSMGHCAKYGTYSLMELNSNKVIYTTTVQSNDVKGSCWMELEGFKRGLNELQSLGLNIKALVTDMHLQIQKYMRENWASIPHYYDVWHVAKGLSKKLRALSKKIGFSLVAKWMKSIINHLYWCASSSAGNGKLAIAKWLSVCNHLQNKHTGHKDPLYPSCTHGPLKKWFKAGTEPFEKLCEIVESTHLKKAVAKLSPYGQTSSIEGFHSIINHYCPKMYHFSYKAMLSRTRIAALHYNENSERDQACNTQGEEEYTIQFPKAKSGGYVVRKIKEECTYEYIDVLLDELYEVVNIYQESDADISEAITPSTLCSSFVRPDKTDAIAQMYSRFKGTSSSMEN